MGKAEREWEEKQTQLKYLLKAVIKTLLSVQYFIYQILKGCHMGGCTKKLDRYIYSPEVSKPICFEIQEGISLQKSKVAKFGLKCTTTTDMFDNVLNWWTNH